MKRNFIGAVVLLFATVGAFATAKNTVLDNVFVQTEEGCIPALAEACDNTGALGCVVPAFDASTSAPLGPQQIYQDPPQEETPLLCETPYRPD